MSALSNLNQAVESARVATGPHNPRRLVDVNKARICDYCGSARAEGYVRSYNAHVCRACYEDHHGPIED